jgi:hypothetical protein
MKVIPLGLRAVNAIAHWIARRAVQPQVRVHKLPVLLLQTTRIEIAIKLLAINEVLIPPAEGSQIYLTKIHHVVFLSYEL